MADPAEWGVRGARARAPLPVSLRLISYRSRDDAGSYSSSVAAAGACSVPSVAADSVNDLRGECSLGLVPDSRAHSIPYLQAWTLATTDLTPLPKPQGWNEFRARVDCGPARELLREVGMLDELFGWYLGEDSRRKHQLGHRKLTLVLFRSAEAVVQRNPVRGERAT